MQNRESSEFHRSLMEAALGAVLILAAALGAALTLTVAPDHRWLQLILNYPVGSCIVAAIAGIGFIFHAAWRFLNLWEATLREELDQLTAPSDTEKP